MSRGISIGYDTYIFLNTNFVGKLGSIYIAAGGNVKEVYFSKEIVQI